MRETELVKQCLELLKWKGILAWRQNTGGVKYGKQFVRFGEPGLSDILGVWADGRFLAIECKVGRNKLSDNQQAFLDNVEKAGGLALVVRDVKDLESVMRDHGL